MGIIDKNDLAQTFHLGFLEAKAKGFSDEHAHSSAFWKVRGYKDAARAPYMHKRCDNCKTIYSWYCHRPCGKCGCRIWTAVGYTISLGYDKKNKRTPDILDQRTPNILDKIEYEQFYALLNTEEQFILSKVAEGYTQKQIANMLQLNRIDITHRFTKMKRKYKEFVKG